MSANYSPENDRSVRYDDPAIAIEWPVEGSTPIVCQPKDRNAPLLEEHGQPDSSLMEKKHEVSGYRRAGFNRSAVCRPAGDKPGAQRRQSSMPLTYAGNPASLRQIENRPNYHFVEADIRDATTVADILNTYESM